MGCCDLAGLFYIGHAGSQCQQSIILLAQVVDSQIIITICWRPYRVECTGSLLTSEVKRHRARIVLGWGTAREVLRVLSTFLLLSCVFFPLITPGIPFDHVIQGTTILFLGLVGGILLFKATTSDNRRGILIAIGFALITISLVLIYQLREVFMSHYF